MFKATLTVSRRVGALLAYAASKVRKRQLADNGVHAVEFGYFDQRGEANGSILNMD